MDWFCCDMVRQEDYFSKGVQRVHRLQFVCMVSDVYI